MVVAARDPESPHHPHFEWDVKKAAAAHWKTQARELIRVVRIIEDNAPPKRAYLSASTKDGTAYHPVGKVVTSADLQLSVLRSALRELEAFEQRYSELEDICELVSVARTKLQKKVA